MRRLTTQWAYRLFWFGLCLLMLPGIWAIALTLLAKGINCPLSDQTGALCQTFGKSIQQSLQHNLSVLMFYLYSMGLPLWVMLSLVRRSFRGWKSQVVGLFCIWWLPHAHTILGLVTSQLLRHSACELYGGNCIVLGTEMGTTLSSQGNSLWLWLLSLPLCAIASMVYLALGMRQLREQRAEHQKGWLRKNM